MTTTDQFLTPTPEDLSHTLKLELQRLVVDYSESRPRSLQLDLGPSEIGHPCDRKLAQTVMREPGFDRRTGDVLPSIVGTGAHGEMEKALQHYNDIHGARYLIEHRIEIRPNLYGHLDCYDAERRTVIDWKFPGNTRMATYRKYGPSQQYFVQAHTYGHGLRLQGIPVDSVAVMFLPRGGRLVDAHLWVEPYNEQVALDAIARMDGIALMVDTFDVENHPENYSLFRREPQDCVFCPFHNPKPTTPYECAGGLA
ncbi:Cas4 exonuclease [Gordonia phage Tarzan]|uniref:Cas4 exonuclease n=1 Tax=Gordonia phage Tarzan TaxID=3038367 RepID=A0AAF0GHZ4_9CAUD|nr:Cas4 exonuclease [Gordonia phage Tarzan]WGH20074.1 Cas4 exonuclease [Gordonia phage Tarzan]